MYSGAGCHQDVLGVWRPRRLPARVGTSSGYAVVRTARRVSRAVEAHGGVLEVCLEVFGGSYNVGGWAVLDGRLGVTLGDGQRDMEQMGLETQVVEHLQYTPCNG